MRKVIAIIICLLPAIGVVTSCASFNFESDADEVQIKDPAEIEGKYSNLPTNKQHLHYNQLHKLIDHVGKIKYVDSIMSSEIKIVDRKKIHFLFRDVRGNEYAYISKYKLENGRIQLRSKNFRLTGIPYLFGGYKLNKTELTLNRQKDLIVRSIHKEDGAILIIIPASIPQSKFENIYPKS